VDKNLPSKTILFDFDGTLADTVDAGVAAFNQLADRYGFVEITTANAESLRAKGPRAVMKELSVPMIRVPTVLRFLRRDLKTTLPSLGFIEDVKSTLLVLKEKGYRLGIVTSNSEENVRIFLSNNGAEIFDFIAAGTGLFNKSIKIKRLIAREGLHKDEIIFVGDEIRDIEAAKKIGIVSIAVTWGLNSREGLMEAAPDFMVNTRAELTALL
jgi:phosphoglycolate phosphatase